VEGREAAIEVRSLSKRFGPLWALREVSLELGRTEGLALFGPNGAGKSTLLKILATVIRSYRGEVRLFGHDLGEQTELVRSHLGYLAHEGFLYQDLTVEENLLFYARLYRVANPRERIAELIQELGLAVKARSVVRHLSRGTKQRLAVARVLLHEPQLLVLDEPFTGLDASGAEKLASLLASFRSSGGTLVMASHSLERGLEVASQVAVLDRGRVVFQGRVEELDREDFLGFYRGVVGGKGDA